MKRVYLICMAISFALLACTHQPAEHDTTLSEQMSGEETGEKSPISIVLEDPDHQVAEHPLSEIAHSIEYIPLESKPQCLIRNMQSAYFIPEGIYVHTPNQLMLFNPEGRFIRNIGSKGKGPAEYQQCSHVAVDHSDGSIWVYDVLSKNMSHYLQNGEMIDHFSLPAENAPADHVLMDESGHLVLVFTDILNSGREVRNKDLAHIYTTGGEKIRTISSTLGKKQEPNAWFLKPEETVYLMMPNETAYVKDKEVYIKEARNDTLYRITEEGKFPQYIISFPRHKMPLEILHFNKDFGNKYIYMQRVVEGGDLLFMMYRFRNKLFTTSWDLKSQKLAVLPPVDGKEPGGYTDDLKYGATFWPRQRLSDKEVLGWIHPLHIPAEALSKMKAEGLRLDMEDNPVLQRVVLK